MHHFTVNGCYRTEINVTPKNWKKLKSLSIDKKTGRPKKWMIYYRFYDPQFKDDPTKWGVLIRLKGMNEADEIEARKKLTQDLIDQEKQLVDTRLFNHATGKLMAKMPEHKSINFSLRDALWWGYEKLNCIQQTKNDIKSVIDGFLTAAETLFDTEFMKTYDKIPVRQFTRSRVYHTLEKCYELNERFSKNRYNVYKAYLSAIYRRLLRFEVVEHNVMRDIEKEKVVKRKRKILTTEEEKLVNDHLYEKSYYFWRFMQVFFYADARETELMKLKKNSDINLKEQEFHVTILKGNRPEESIKQISNEVLPLWREIMDEAKQGEYLFSKGLKPGPHPIRPDQIGRRWYKLVKRPKVKGGLGIKKDFRSLNHSHMTKVSKLLGIKAAQISRGHKTPIVTMQHYDINYKKNELNEVKNAGVKLGS